MSITLPSELEEFVEREIASGKYRTRDEVISEGVRILRERERKLEQLRADIQVGLDQIERGEVIRISTEEERQALIDEIQSLGREQLKREAAGQ